MKRRQFLATTIAFGASAFTRAADEPLPRDGKNLSFRNEIRDSLNRSLVWLRAQQNADGSFGKDTLHPALTALPLIAFQREPTGRFAKEEFVAKGYAYLRSFTQPDGGIYSKENGLANYNTSVCLLALVGANEPKDLDTLVKARAYVVGQQAAGMAKPETDGGIGYGSIGASPKRGHPDLDNTVVALEALRATKHLIADKPGTKDLNWNAAIDFVARCQNLPSNKQPWASGDADNKGGFIYYPGFSNAGEVTLEGGGKALRSYGSMSYAGLLSFIYADVKSDDPRVTAAVAWLRKHYTLDENPGLEKSGYFYYLHLMAKGLTAAGITELEVGGKKSDWRLALAERLMKLQQQDGSWLNDTARWKENNPVLVTTYCALTLEILYAQL
ncbi:cycloartenol synthase [Verrucomicrobiota bacterium]|jgi:squalene-hopene/tetraprenyl-beta-curcumene cyclase|nr:cycloartenol synthase [Verrucomicrobiota bacterium]